MIPTSVLITLSILGLISLGVWLTQLTSWIFRPKVEQQETEAEIELRYLKPQLDKEQVRRQDLEIKEAGRSELLINSLTKG